MPYTLGERIYGIREAASLGAGAGFSQRMRDIYMPYDTRIVEGSGPIPFFQ